MVYKKHAPQTLHLQLLFGNYTASPTCCSNKNYLRLDTLTSHVTLSVIMTTSLFLLGLLALLQVVNSRSVSEQSDGVPGLTQDFQSVLANLLLQAQEELPSETQDQNYPGGDMHESFDETFEQDYPDDVQDQGQGPSKEFLKELEESLKEGSEDQLSFTTEIQNSASINSGDTIALQTANRLYWMSFWGNKRPHLETCPGLFFDEHDYTRRCVGEVMQIYRANGPGSVKVGDLIGIYYPIDKKWLGCHGSGNCYKHACPGHPTLAYGFSNYEHWHRCYGEIYKIYARGKKNGDIITHKDDVMILFLQNFDYLSFPGGTIHRNPCPSGHRPPSREKYDCCWGEVFNIWKRGLSATE